MKFKIKKFRINISWKYFQEIEVSGRIQNTVEVTRILQCLESNLQKLEVLHCDILYKLKKQHALMYT